MLFVKNQINSSAINTVTHEHTATGKRPFPERASVMPTISAARPDHGLAVAWRIDGNVITASVTYGT